MHSYGAVAADHYAAYRPPLHRLILREALGDIRLDWALDFGCGTGQSSHALADYANTVIGVDNSADMLAEAEAHARISYRLGHERDIPASDRSIELFTMAGVLPYLDRTVLMPELRRVAARNALLLSYDFKVDLTPLLALFPKTDLRSREGYDHKAHVNETEHIRFVSQGSATMAFQLDAVQATHLVLANETRSKALSLSALGEGNLFARVHAAIDASDFPRQLDAACNWSLHASTQKA